MFNAIGENKQSYYKKGLIIKKVKAKNIEGICKCGFLTLKPTNDFEKYNGGLTIKMSEVSIIGNINECNTYYNCNACVNNWR